MFIIWFESPVVVECLPAYGGKGTILAIEMLDYSVSIIQSDILRCPEDETSPP